MPASFDYAVVELVPRVDRGERINVGVVVYCRTLDFLAAKMALDARLVEALAPSLDVQSVERALAMWVRICAGDVEMGPVAALPQADRFHWLVAPRSTVVQTAPVHSGLCDDPARALDLLLARMVLRP